MRSPAHVYSAPTVIPAAMEGTEPVLLSKQVNKLVICYVADGGDGGWVGGLLHVTEGTTDGTE